MEWLETFFYKDLGVRFSSKTFKNIRCTKISSWFSLEGHLILNIQFQSIAVLVNVYFREWFIESRVISSIIGNGNFCRSVPREIRHLICAMPILFILNLLNNMDSMYHSNQNVQPLFPCFFSVLAKIVLQINIYVSITPASMIHVLSSGHYI